MYARVYDQIFSSSIMEENIETRYIWFCLLTLADKEGFVDMTIPAIARRINLEESIVTKAIEKFMLPDPSSRTLSHEGKRLEKIRESFGWKIINYIHYRDLRNEENRREYMREYMRGQRNVNKKVNSNVNKLTVSTCKPPLATTATATATATATKDKYSRNSDEFRLSSLLLSKILERRPTYKKPNLQKWAKQIDLMIRIDKRNIAEIEKIIIWCQSDSFWQNNILSVNKLREQFDRLALQKETKLYGQTGRGKQPLAEKERGVSKYAGLEVETINTDDQGITE